ncbi:MAG: hypothetical protein IPM79_01900 [Polyangiaceae bacterium]|nr:hypothetical protein [Polyangiaceae bacterium]MBK8936424.1 hypothetical protein [Polyangiaceae bacterium]
MTGPAIRPKAPRAGGEIDAFCTKCKMDLNHRIVAMVGDDVKRVKCLTCDGEHNYRKPMAERERARAQKEMKRAIHAPKDGSGPSTSSRSSASKVNPKVAWEKSIAGQPPTAFRAYSVKATFAQGELIRHTKFGDGVIARIIDPLKVEVLFEDGPKTMAQGMVDA